MDPYAAPADLEERWRPLSPEEKSRAGALLADASAMLAAEFARAGIEPDEGTLGLAAMVACSMVRRAMAAGTGADVSQLGITVGQFSEQRTFANPAANLYINPDERRLLGIPKRRQRIGFLKCWGDGDAR